MEITIKNLPDVKTSDYLPSVELIGKAQEILSFSMGAMMQKYLLECGFLEFSFVEISGIYENKGLDSDLITNTLRLRKQYNQLEKYVVLEDKGDGDYTLCNEQDEIFNFIPTCSDEPTSIKYNLLQYFEKRYRDVVAQK